MHPADEFEAFKELVEKGIPVADVAARFGVTPNRRLATPGLNPGSVAKGPRRTAGVV